MNKEQNDLNKSIDSLIESFFSEPTEQPVAKSIDIAGDSKTTADAAIAAAPALQDDASRGAGRPKAISDVPKNDEDGKRDGQYDASIASNLSEEENEEAKKQAKSTDQTTSSGRISKSITDEEYAEFQAFKKAQAQESELKKAEELKKADDLRKAELENLVKSAVTAAIEPLKKENQELKKSLGESDALIKAMAAQPRQSKSVTGIDALEKSLPENTAPTEFTKREKLDAAERLVMKKSLPMEAVIELENTGTVYRRDWQTAIEQELQNQK